MAGDLDLRAFLTAEIGATTGAGVRFRQFCDEQDAELRELQAKFDAQTIGFEALRRERDGLIAELAARGDQIDSLKAGKK